eukprot:429835-Pelagomonas_calceolata.AAC.6
MTCKESASVPMQTGGIATSSDSMEASGAESDGALTPGNVQEDKATARLSPASNLFITLTLPFSKQFTELKVQEEPRKSLPLLPSQPVAQPTPEGTLPQFPLQQPEGELHTKMAREQRAMETVVSSKNTLEEVIKMSNAPEASPRQPKQGCVH